MHNKRKQTEEKKHAQKSKKDKRTKNWQNIHIYDSMMK